MFTEVSHFLSQLGQLENWKRFFSFLKLSSSRLCLSFIISLFHSAFLLISHFHSYANIVKSVTIKYYIKSENTKFLIKYIFLFFSYSCTLSSSSALCSLTCPIYAINLTFSIKMEPLQKQTENLSELELDILQIIGRFDEAVKYLLSVLA